MAENTSESRTDLIDIYKRMLSAAGLGLGLGQNPDVGIDLSLVKSSGLNSAAELENSVNQELKDVCSKIPGYVEGLGSDLSAFETVPNAVGLGAVVVSIGLELIIAAEDRESKDSSLDMMRSSTSGIEA